MAGESAAIKPERFSPYLDTSALAKWYVNEALSGELEEYLRTFPFAFISSLTLVEMRCLLARRQRYGELEPEQAKGCFALFQDDIRRGHLRVLPLEDRHTSLAVDLLGLLSKYSLRTLDALHLAIARSGEQRSVATADRLMADAAEAAGFHVVRFIP